MLIAFDFDGTWTADPATFKAIAEQCQQAGHSCVCITQRAKDDDQQTLENSIGTVMPILYAAGKPKRTVAQEHGLTVDVWLDNQPETIGAATSAFQQGGGQSVDIRVLSLQQEVRRLQERIDAQHQEALQLHRESAQQFNTIVAALDKIPVQSIFPARREATGEDRYSPRQGFF
ncbi:hypothetical protein [Thiolinea disciformis]|uniref:hypothetical protein n=1 Tax=Thiolinea disciformis TaxID=125614 RepID=UPI00036EAE58|nr:hypothetical protein [Thiolinea disciformis]